MADDIKKALQDAGLDELPDLGSGMTLEDCKAGCEQGCWGCTACFWSGAPC